MKISGPVWHNLEGLWQSGSQLHRKCTLELFDSAGIPGAVHTSVPHSPRQCGCMQVLDEVMKTRGRPDAALYATIIEGLWQSGSQPQRLRALKHYKAALQGNVHGLAASVSGGETSVEVEA